ncbi:DJ-1/PfpI family protein [Streptomyces sp. NPDC058000]|uniref:DJ-1/PfpI family protein n=1 Tax=Streptomyces sp. NPDC058000 TaxID=3346299 RepID=UPI0036E9D347
MLAQFVLFDGFDPLDVVAPYEVLHCAGELTAGAVRTELVSAEGPREVPSGLADVSLRATAALDPERADLVVLPGAVGDLRDPAELTEAERARTIPAILRRALDTALPRLVGAALARPETLVATVCGGSLIVAMAGLAQGRPVTTHPLGRKLLDGTGAQHVDARVVDDGDLLTSGGVTSGLDLALHLVEREIGPRVAYAVERVLVYERRGVVWSATGAVPALAL